MDSICVGIVDENEIFRRGLVACFAADLSVTVSYESAQLQPEAHVALVISSVDVATSTRFPVPLLVCTDAPITDQVRQWNTIMGVLPRAALKPAQLIAGVRAAASGLQVNLLDSPSASLSGRHMDVLKLLAEGAATRQISDRLGYSERTIKHAVAEIMEELGAHSRAEAVAMGIRRGLI